MPVVSFDKNGLAGGTVREMLPPVPAPIVAVPLDAGQVPVVAEKPVSVVAVAAVDV